MVLISKPQFRLANSYNDNNLMPTRDPNEAKYTFYVAEDTIIKPFYEVKNIIMTNDNNQFVPYDPTSYFYMDEVNDILTDKNCAPTRVPTGIQLSSMPEHLCLELVLDPSLASNFLLLANGARFIDNKYSVEEPQIYFDIISLFPYNICLRQGEKLGQGYFSSIQAVLGDVVLLRAAEEQQ